jgi:hypothetical protein
MNMKLTLLAAVTAFCACNTAFAKWGTAVDRGTVLSPDGIVPNPGENLLPYWGGNSRDQTDWAVTAFDASGNPHPVIDGADVTPAGYTSGGAIMTGYSTTTAGYVAAGGPTHAASWVNGTFKDLHPSGFASSIAQGVGGAGNIVGMATDTSGLLHPWLFVDNFEGLPGKELPTPTGFNQAVATSLAQSLGLYIGGYALNAGQSVHPIMWAEGNSTNFTPVDLLSTLPGSTSGVIVAGTWDSLDGDGSLPVFAGSVTTTASNGEWHAALWVPYAQGTTGIGYDLHPAGSKYLASSIYAMRLLNKNTVYEAGLAVTVRGRKTAWHAMVWQGSAASASDLNGKLPKGEFIQSTATGIDELGNVEGAAEDKSGVWHEVYWPVEK